MIEFISTFDEYLHASSQDEFIKATPRSWERVSDALKAMDGSHNFSKETLYHFIRGNVGTRIAQDFMGFLKENENPMLKAKDIFSLELITQSVKDEIASSTHSRLYILMMNMLKELQLNQTLDRAKRIGEVLLLYPRDLRISLMKEIRDIYQEDIYPILLNDDLFLEAFFECYR